ncbi:hypothetical protein NPIL_419281, partial [Nephila pilipes]
MNQLQKLNKDLNFKTISSLQIYDCKAKIIKSISFLNFSVNHLRSTCPFSKIDDNSLTSIDSLKELKLFSTDLLNIPKEVGKLDDLKLLHINDGKLKFHFEKEIQNMTKLRELSLKNNQLHQIGPKAFSGNINLKIIDLSRNSLIKLPSGIFEENRNLKKVFLQINKLNSTQGVFENSNIEEINIRDNKLTSIKDAFQHDLEL